MSRRTPRRPRTPPRDRLGQHLTQALALALAATTGCADGSSASDAEPVPGGHFDVGGCSPAEHWQVPYCAPGPDAALTDAAGPDATEPDAGPDAALTDDAGPDAGPDAEPDGDAGPDAGLEVDPATGCILGPPPADGEARALPDPLCYDLCGRPPQSDLSCSATAAGVECTVPEFCGIGRRPAHSALGAPLPEALTLGAWLGAAAGLEAASVGAFEALAHQLRRLGAPRALVRAARRAAADERRHTRSVRALARRHGDDLRPWTAPESGPSDAFQLALENRLEGCLRETFGAAVAAYQAARATDPAIARAFGVIAREEAEHGRLAWQIAAWLEPRLSDAERAALDAATDAALATLTVTPLRPADRVRAGLPGPRAFAALRASLRALWRLPPAAALAAA